MCEHVEGAAAIREQTAADVCGDWLRLSGLGDRAGCLVVVEIKLDRYACLINRAMLQNQCALLDGRGVNDLSERWRLSGLGGDPISAVCFDFGGRVDGNRLTLH